MFFLFRKRKQLFWALSSECCSKSPVVGKGHPPLCLVMAAFALLCRFLHVPSPARRAFREHLEPGFCPAPFIRVQAPVARTEEEAAVSQRQSPWQSETLTRLPRGSRPASLLLLCFGEEGRGISKFQKGGISVWKTVFVHVFGLKRKLRQFQDMGVSRSRFGKASTGGGSRADWMQP